MAVHFLRLLELGRLVADRLRLAVAHTEQLVIGFDRLIIEALAQVVGAH